MWGKMKGGGLRVQVEESLDFDVSKTILEEARFAHLVNSAE